MQTGASLTYGFPVIRGTHSELKRQNRRLVLQALYKLELTTRVALANATGLTKPTISSLVSEFLEEGLVNEWMQSISPMVGAGPDHVVPGEFLPQEFIFQRETLIECGRDIIIRGRLG